MGVGEETEGQDWLGFHWGQIKAAPVAYDVVSFLPTQTSSTRLIVFAVKEKAPRSSPGGLQVGTAWLIQDQAALIEVMVSLRKRSLAIQRMAIVIYRYPISLHSPDHIFGLHPQVVD